MDPGTDVEDERPTPVGSPSPVVDGAVPLSTPSGVDMELAQVVPGSRCPAGDGDSHSGA